MKSTDWVSLFVFSGFKSGETLSGGKIIEMEKMKIFKSVLIL